MDKQKVTSSKKILATKLFDVHQLKVEFPNGKSAIHHVVERKPVVYIFPITPKYEIYLVKEYSYNTDDDVLQVPAGYIEDNENPLQAAKRELQEETGIHAEQWEALPTLEYSKSSLKAKAYLYIAKNLEVSVAHPEETESIEVLKLSLNQAVEKVMNGEIRKAAAVAGILMLNKLKSEKKL